MTFTTVTADSLRELIDRGVFSSRVEEAIRRLHDTTYAHFQGVAYHHGAEVAKQEFADLTRGDRERAAQLEPIARGMEAIARVTGDAGPIVGQAGMSFPGHIFGFRVSQLGLLDPRVDFAEVMAGSPLALMEVYLMSDDVQPLLTSLTLRMRRADGFFLTVGVYLGGSLNASAWEGPDGEMTVDENLRGLTIDELTGMEGASAYFTELLPRFAAYLHTVAGQLTPA